MLLTITIIICLFWIIDTNNIWFIDNYTSFSLCSQPLMTLMAWYWSTPWGIVMCCLGAITIIVEVAKNK